MGGRSLREFEGSSTGMPKERPGERGGGREVETTASITGNFTQGDSTGQPQSEGGAVCAQPSQQHPPASDSEATGRTSPVSNMAATRNAARHFMGNTVDRFLASANTICRLQSLRSCGPYVWRRSFRNAICPGSQEKPWEADPAQPLFRRSGSEARGGFRPNAGSMPAAGPRPRGHPS